MVTREEFKKSQERKLDYCIFRDYEKMVSSDRTQELKNFEFEEKIFNLERAMNDYVKIEDNIIELQDKVSLVKLDEMHENLNNLRSISATMEETLSHKLSVLKDDFENKTKEMMDNLEDLNKKMEEIEDEDGSYDDESE